MATPGTVQEAGVDAASAPGGHFELLPGKGSLRRRGSGQRQHQITAAPGARL